MLESTRLVGRPVFFSMAIILLAFIPVFALTGQEGKLFHPLAFTKTFAVLAATVIAVTLVPVLCTLLLGGTFHAEERQPGHARRCAGSTGRCSSAALRASRSDDRWPRPLLFAGALFVGTRHRQRVHAAAERRRPDVHADRRSEHLARGEHEDRRDARTPRCMTFPEVAYAVAKVARADTSTDPAPLNMTETIVHLKPREQWRPGMTLDRLRAEMGRAVQLPGVSNIWTMPIINRIDMLTTGIRSEVGVKIFGTDLPCSKSRRDASPTSCARVPGASNVYPEQVTSGQYLNIDVDRAAAARYGIGVGDVQQVIETAIGETTLTTTIEGRRRFPVRVRYAPRVSRRSRRRSASVLVASPRGAQIPLERARARSSTRADPR